MTDDRPLASVLPYRGCPPFSERRSLSAQPGGGSHAEAHHHPVRHRRVRRQRVRRQAFQVGRRERDRKSTRLNSSHGYISYAVFCLKKKKKKTTTLMHTSL